MKASTEPVLVLTTKILLVAIRTAVDPATSATQAEQAIATAVQYARHARHAARPFLGEPFDRTFRTKTAVLIV